MVGLWEVSRAWCSISRGWSITPSRAERIAVTRPTLIEFPADDPGRACRFWSGLLGVSLDERGDEEGSGWQTRGPHPQVGVHERGRGPGDSFSLPYFTVDDLDEALERVKQLGGSVIHPGSKWAICRDSEGSPFGLARAGDR
jgi:predicted enzyme related to lactoylglutathione lyase